MSDTPGHQQQVFSKRLEEIDNEIARLALLCRIPLLDPGMLERVLKNDASVCGTDNSRAFSKLRSLLMLHYSVREKAVVELGQAETLAMVDDIVAGLRRRIGDRLGGPAG